ncbi:effector protein A, substrate of the Dot/Icm secretion system [Legionella lansingensis]|uniref:Effector protein A, substrate of the Dot/Icm secretion system n=1 Tax=Legionella lansingensis TaxID=45067 RepID=A0A0W0VRL5_9GAMM|nr:hypothetical protein [Legionella lansingensis]KTD22671.1 effector protein A, substrate of the Dot/Icm secretion system [Legionella lansingensis]SNV55713.1 effector protein A, substrate of the Dot/Icm secretion system [Legionella lansingensis]
MKDKMISLMNKLSGLSQPYALENLILLFDGCNDIFLEDIKPPESLAPLWHALRNIRTQVLEWKRIETQQQEIVDLEADIIRLNKDLLFLAEQMELHKSFISEQQRQVNEVYPPLLQTYHRYLLDKEPTIAVSTPSNLRQQKNLILAYLEVLKNQYKALDLKNISLKLAEALIARKRIVAQLKLLNVIVTENSSSYKIYEVLKRNRETLAQLKVELEKIQQELAESISLNEVQENIRNKTQVLRRIEAELLSLERKLTESSLTSDIKEKLKNEYLKATNKAKFVVDRENVVFWHGSLINPRAWYEWGTNTEFKVKLEQLQAEEHYVRLLHQKEEKILEHNNLNQQLKRNQGFIISPSLKSDTDHSKLNERAIQLLTQYDFRYKPISQNSVDLLSDVVDRIGPLSKKIDEFDTALRLLLEAIAIDEDVLELRTRYALLDDIDELIPTTEELKKLRDSDGERQKELLNLDEKIKSCEKCLINMDSISDYSIQLKEGEKKKIHLTATLQHRKKLLAKNPDRNNYESKREQAQQLIRLQIASLNEILNDITSPQEETRDISDEIPTKFNLLITYQNTLTSWNRLISNANTLLPKELKEWYQELFIALQAHVRDETSYYQASHLLHDVLFEIQYPAEPEKFPVLAAYQKLCPNPHHSWQVLLNLKPPFYSSNNKLPNPRNPILWSKLEELYQQQKILAEEYPREAELLHQAIHQIHQAALSIESSSQNVLPKNLNLLHDPRYESLQNHRGFGKVWQWLAQLCAYILESITKRQDINYRQFFFFQRTQTSKLLEEATSQLVNPIAG